MKILDSYLDECYEKKDGYDVHYRFIGDMSLFSEYPGGDSIIKRMDELDRLTASNTKTINIAINYGGRDEIVHAVNKLLVQGKKEITKEDISENVYTAGYPEPDLIVRTGGDLRISNFLLWQSAYSEFYFTDVLWPDLTTDDVDKAIENFYSRKRRFGGVDKS
jgi:undecaprenyl diphosphate synthase